LVAYHVGILGYFFLKIKATIVVKEIKNVVWVKILSKIKPKSYVTSNVQSKPGATGLNRNGTSNTGMN